MSYLKFYITILGKKLETVVTNAVNKRIMPIIDKGQKLYYKWKYIIPKIPKVPIIASVNKISRTSTVDIRFS